MKVIITIEVEPIGRDVNGTGRRRTDNGDYYREMALELLRADPVKYVDQAYVEGE